MVWLNDALSCVLHMMSECSYFAMDSVTKRMAELPCRIVSGWGFSVLPEVVRCGCMGGESAISRRYFSTFHIYVCDEIGIVSSVVRNGCFTERVLNAMVVAVGRKSIGKTHGGRSVLLLLGSFWGEGFQVRVGLVLGML